MTPHLHFEDVSVIEKPHLSLGARFASRERTRVFAVEGSKMIILLIVLILVFGFGAIEWDLVWAITEAAVKNRRLRM